MSEQETIEGADPTPPRPTQGLSRATSYSMVLILIVAGAVIWWLQFHVPIESDPSVIGRIPMEIGRWRGEDIPISEAVERMLRADAQVQRKYQSPDAELVWLYIGYYGTARGGRPEHTPWACYPSAGWVILSALELKTNEGDGGAHPGKLNEFVVEQGGARRLVHFWYQTHRKERITTETELTIDHVLGRLSPGGRADGALVRLSTPIDRRGLDAARKRLRDFAATLGPVLRENWPI